MGGVRACLPRKTLLISKNMRKGAERRHQYVLGCWPASFQALAAPHTEGRRSKPSPPPNSIGVHCEKGL